MKTSTRIGFFVVALGLMLLLVPAVLPVSVVTTGTGVSGVRVADDGCGASAYAAVRHPDRRCGQAARERLQLTATGASLLIVTGLVVLAGGEGRRRSRVSAGGEPRGHHP